MVTLFTSLQKTPSPAALRIDLTLVLGLFPPLCAADSRMAAFTQQDVSDHCEDPVEFALWLQGMHMLDSNPHCTCGTAANVQASSAFHGDGVCFRCPNTACRRFWSVREGSRLPRRCHLSLVKFCRLLCAFDNRATISSTARQWAISRRIVSEYYVDFTNAITGAVDAMTVAGDFDFAGGDYVVELDECLYQRVRDTAAGVTLATQWVWGVYEQATGKCWFERIPNRTRNTLMAVVELHVPVGTIICTDEFSSYTHGLSARGYFHYSVNHSAGEYVRDEECDYGTDGVPIQFQCTTNHLESKWALLRGLMRPRKLRTVTHLDAQLSRMMFESANRRIFELYTV